MIMLYRLYPQTGFLSFCCSVCVCFQVQTFSLTDMDIDQKSSRNHGRRIKFADAIGQMRMECFNLLQESSGFRARVHVRFRRTQHAVHGLSGITTLSRKS